MGFSLSGSCNESVYPEFMEVLPWRIYFGFRKKLTPREHLIYLGYWGRAAKKGIVFHDFGINMGLSVSKIGINKGIDFSKIGINFTKYGLIFVCLHMHSTFKQYI